MPKKFHYSMQNILDIRENEKKGKELELAAAFNALRNEKQHLQQILELIEKEFNPNPEQIRRATADYFVQREKYYRKLRILKSQRENAVKMAERNVEKKRSELNDAMVEEKKFIKNREGQFKQYQRQLNREEQKINDEISNAIHLASNLR